MWKINFGRPDNPVKELRQKNVLLEKRASQFQAIIDSMVEGVIVLDTRGAIILINPAVEKIFSIQKENCLNKTILEAIRNPELFEIYSKVLDSGLPAAREINMLLPVRKNFRVNAVTVKQEGEVWAVAMILNDISEIRRLELIRKDFVANVSHELKTPLTAIKGFMETLLDGAIDDRENNRRFLQIINEHTRRLENLVGDLLELARLESDETSLSFSRFELLNLVNEAAESFNPRLKEKDIEFKAQLPRELSLTADREKLRQVFNNLIDNAIKFNRPKGLIRIYAEDNRNSIKIAVEDSGCGIPAKDSLRVFERFYRSDKARSRELGGTGLGLSIVKHIVELHGGSAGVESAEGLGSKFWFTLPKKI